MTTFVADTHAMIWRAAARSRLGEGAREAFERADRGEALVIVPAVVVAEMSMVAEKGRVPGWTPAALDALVREVTGSPNYRTTALTPDLVLASRTLVAIPDIFDRLIAAEALSLGATLVSRDAVFAGLVTTVWERA